MNPPLPIREAIISAIFQRLQALGWPGLTVERNRVVEVQDFPSLILYEGDEDSPDEDSAAARCSMEIDLEAYLEVSASVADAGARLGSDLNRLLALVEAAVLGGSNQTPEWWGDLGIADIRRGALTRTLETSESDTPKIGGTLQIIVDYWTLPGDPYSPGP